MKLEISVTKSQFDVESFRRLGIFVSMLEEKQNKSALQKKIQIMNLFQNA